MLIGYAVADVYLHVRCDLMQILKCSSKVNKFSKIVGYFDNIDLNVFRLWRLKCFENV